MAEMTRRAWAALGLTLLLALGLRLVNLGGRALWYDEAFAVLFAEKGWDAMVDGTLTPVDGGAADVHPLLYYALLDAWMKSQASASSQPPPRAKPLTAAIVGLSNCSTSS